MANDRAAPALEAAEVCVRLCNEWGVAIPSPEYERLAGAAGRMVTFGGSLAEIERSVRSMLMEKLGAPQLELPTAPEVVPLAAPREDL